jgi:thiamine pyrophosphokinase
MVGDKRFVMLVCGSPRGVSPELLWELAEGMSFVVAVDSGAEWLSEAGVIPDLLIGDMDSCSQKTRDSLRELEVEEIVFPVAKDASDLELALAEIQKRGYTDLVATNVLGGRLDHELVALGNLVAAGEEREGGEKGLAITVVEPNQTLIFLNSPGARQQLHLNFSADLNPDDAPTISLLSWGGQAVVSEKGFQWPLDHATLSPNSSLGLSNIPNSGEPSIELHSGAAIVIIQTPAV